MFLVGGAIHGLQSHLIAHTSARRSAQAAGGDWLQLLEVCNHCREWHMWLFAHDLEEAGSFSVFILRCFIHKYQVDTPQCGWWGPCHLGVCALPLVLQDALDCVDAYLLDTVLVGQF